MYRESYSLPSFFPLATLDHPFLVVSLLPPPRRRSIFIYIVAVDVGGLERPGDRVWNRGKKEGGRGRPREECEFFNFMRDVYLMIMLITSR